MEKNVVDGAKKMICTENIMMKSGVRLYIMTVLCSNF